MFKLSNQHAGRNFASADRDKIMIGVVVALLVIAAVILFFYFKKDTASVSIGDGLLAIECVNPNCGNKWSMAEEDVNAALMAMEPELRASMADGLRLKCDKCNEQTGLQGMYCPRCQKSFVDPYRKAVTARRMGYKVKVPARGPVSCPHCGLEDVEDYYRKNKGKIKAR